MKDWRIRALVGCTTIRVPNDLHEELRAMSQQQATLHAEVQAVLTKLTAAGFESQYLHLPGLITVRANLEAVRAALGVDNP
jgi:hypothetical protein